MKKLLLVMLLVASSAWGVTTVRDLEFGNIGKRKIVFGTIGFDDSYASGGEVVTPAMVGLSTVDMMVFASDPYGCTFNYTTDSYGGGAGNIQIHNFGTTYDDGSLGVASDKHVMKHATFNIVVDGYGELSNNSDITWLPTVNFMAVGN